MLDLRLVKTFVLFGVTATAALYLPLASGATNTVTKSVSAKAGPWAYVGGGLNTSLQYGVGDQSGATAFTGADGFQFAAGDTLAITYLSGLTNAFGATPNADAGGDTNFLFNAASGSSGKVAPSFYFSPSDYPVYLAELVGTFADATGAVVGTPFNIGLSRSVVIPTGAAALQLGLNDDIYADNTGLLSVSVTGPAAVPEASTFALMLLGSLALIHGTRRSAAPGRRAPTPLWGALL